MYELRASKRCARREHRRERDSSAPAAGARAAGCCASRTGWRSCCLDCISLWPLVSTRRCRRRSCCFTSVVFCCGSRSGAASRKLYIGQAVLIVGCGDVAGGRRQLVADGAVAVACCLRLIGGEVPAIKNVGQRIVSLIAADIPGGDPAGLGRSASVRADTVRRVFADCGALRAHAAAWSLIFLVKTEARKPPSSYSVDLVYSLLLFLMVVVLVLGAFVMRAGQPRRLCGRVGQALLVIGGILVALSWLWDPRAGFAGIGQLLTRYFLSVGMPFERWMHASGKPGRPGTGSRSLRGPCGGGDGGIPLDRGHRLADRAKPRAWRADLSRHGTPCSFGGLVDDAVHALVCQPCAGAAHAAAGAAAGRLPRNQAARVGAAPKRLSACDLRNWFAPHA